MPKKIIILASGGGSNAASIITYFASKTAVQVHSILCNRAGAGVFAKGADLGVPVHLFEAANPQELIAYAEEHQPDLIVLAGYLKKIPAALIDQFPNRIINIHPALLPKYGGKGMYGMHVHRAIKAAEEKESGMTIHYVNEQYDEGNIIRQERVALSADDGPQEIAQKVLALEHRFYPQVIEQLLTQYG